MAKSQQQRVEGSIVGAEDGFLLIRGLEDKALTKLLELYGAQIAGYRQTPGDMFTNVTMKITFAGADNENNVNLWSFFIAKAAHPTVNKPRIKVFIEDGGAYAFVTWPVWNEPKYMASKNQSNNNRW